MTLVIDDKLIRFPTVYSQSAVNKLVSSDVLRAKSEKVSEALKSKYLLYLLSFYLSIGTGCTHIHGLEWNDDIFTSLWVSTGLSLILVSQGGMWIRKIGKVWIFILEKCGKLEKCARTRKIGKIWINVRTREMGKIWINARTFGKMEKLPKIRCTFKEICLKSAGTKKNREIELIYWSTDRQNTHLTPWTQHCRLWTPNGHFWCTQFDIEL